MEEPKHPAPVDLDAERLRESTRAHLLHQGVMVGDKIALDMGTPDDWLFSALSHLKARWSLDRAEAGEMAIVSHQALSIVIGKLEEMLVGGKPWPWPEEDDG